MALISVVRDQFVNREKVIEDKDILDGISIASVLPGPMAVNVVVFIGNRLRGVPGALVSMIGVLLPTFALILLLSYLYFENSELKYVPEAFNGILPAVCGVIVATAWKMSRKNVKNWQQWAILLASGATLVLFKGFVITLAVIVGGALLGLVLFSAKNEMKPNEPKASKRKNQTVGIIAIALFILAVYGCLFAFTNPQFGAGIRQLYTTMAGMSVALFGGGYVFLPAMQQVVVENMGWLSEQQFVDGIALGQVTPGPIMITATFIGYKTHGVIGAVVATIGMFMPPGLIMIIVSSFFSRISQNRFVVAAFKGIRPAVIGMIFVASFLIAQSIEVYWQSAIIFTASLLISIFTKLQVVLLIAGAAIAGILVF